LAGGERIRSSTAHRSHRPVGPGSDRPGSRPRRRRPERREPAVVPLSLDRLVPHRPEPRSRERQNQKDGESGEEAAPGPDPLRRVRDPQTKSDRHRKQRGRWTDEGEQKEDRAERGVPADLVLPDGAGERIDEETEKERRDRLGQDEMREEARGVMDRPERRAEQGVPIAPGQPPDGEIDRDAAERQQGRLKGEDREEVEVGDRVEVASQGVDRRQERRVPGCGPRSGRSTIERASPPARSSSANPSRSARNRTHAGEGG